MRQCSKCGGNIGGMRISCGPRPFRMRRCECNDPPMRKLAKAFYFVGLAIEADNFLFRQRG